ncbi:TetR/AcrR family transcriptional regulator [Pseudarthrobacter sp. NPDC092419]|uniref:TetR/AcrR family transcriptional regulator n=1 Tax=Pseudarthrobacter sp. NPDC092419 TaxID=3364414 RepID=UPI0038088B31
MRVDTNGTEERIIESATRLFNTWGYTGMTLRQIAKEVGIEAQSIYNYTTSKQALVEKMIRAGTEALHNSVVTALEAADPSPSARLAAAVEAHVVHYASSPHVVMFRDSLIHFNEDVRTSLRAMLKSYEQLFKDIIREGMESGDFRWVDETPAAFAILGMGESVTNWWRPGGRLSAAEVGAMYGDLAVRMVTASPDLLGSSTLKLPRSSDRT